MKKIMVLFFGIFSIYLGGAQAITEFPAEHDKYMKELGQYMTASKMEPNIKLMEELQKMIKENKLPANWLDEVIVTSNLMLGRMMASYPHFFHYLTAVANAVKSGKSDAQFSEWNKMLAQIIANQKKGDNNDFLKFVEFSDGFFLQNALNTTPAKTWKVETNNYKFTFQDNKPVVVFPTTTLWGVVKGDSLAVMQTEGTYYPLETRWVGKSGKVDWARAGRDPNKVFCTFKNYSVNTSNFYYNVDTVLFTNTEYFDHQLKGKFMDKMVSSADSNSMSYPPL
jgi:hypothetical protein